MIDTDSQVDAPLLTLEVPTMIRKGVSFTGTITLSTAIQAVVTMQISGAATFTAQLLFSSAAQCQSVTLLSAADTVCAGSRVVTLPVTSFSTAGCSL